MLPSLRKLPSKSRLNSLESGIQIETQKIQAVKPIIYAQPCSQGHLTSGMLPGLNKFLSKPFITQTSHGAVVQIETQIIQIE